MPPQPTSEQDAFRRPDASMSLLITMMHNSLDEGYAEATARRAVRGESGLSRGAGARVLVGIGVGLVAVVLTMAAVQMRVDAPAAERERKELVAKVREQEAEVDRLQDDVERLRDEVDAIRDGALSPADQERERLLDLLSGNSPVQGQGLKVVADDAEGVDTTDDSTDPRQAEIASNGRLLDRDLQLLVNGLWKAGAEAIAINGQRLTALSAIRAAGAAVLVDNRPQSPPYTVLAIGNGNRMRTGFQDGAEGRYLRTLQSRYGIRLTISTQKKISLPAASGLSLRVALPEGRPAPAPAPAPGAPAAPTAPSSPAPVTTRPAATGTTPRGRTSSTSPGATASPKATRTAAATAAGTTGTATATTAAAHEPAERRQEGTL